MTGRSGGGAYSWWITALDDRIKASVPVAGITNLHNHVVDGCVEGHCDCMFVVNTYRWDYARVAALAAPRPLLIANSDKDSIFPLDGVVDVYNDARDLYKRSARKIGSGCTSPVHSDATAALGAFHWLNRHLREARSATFSNPLPSRCSHTRNCACSRRCRRTSGILRRKIGSSPPRPIRPSRRMRRLGRRSVMPGGGRCAKRHSAVGWTRRTLPNLTPPSMRRRRASGSARGTFSPTVRSGLRILATPADLADAAPDLYVLLTVLGDDGWRGSARPTAEPSKDHRPGAEADDKSWGQTKKMFGANKWAMACYVAPRGIGLEATGAATTASASDQRRFVLLGETLDGARLGTPGGRSKPCARHPAAACRSGLGAKAMPPRSRYAPLFEPGTSNASISTICPPAMRWDRPSSNVLPVPRYAGCRDSNRALDLRSTAQTGEAWAFPQSVAAKLGWGEKRIQLR
ncbi:MAG: hypothetical protein R3F11_12115 [Verrucomicrobiales bacterium]